MPFSSGEQQIQTGVDEPYKRFKVRGMKKLPWILIVLLAILSGCATPENIDRNVQIDYSNGLHQMQNRMDSLLYNMQLTQKETNEKLSNLQLENKTVYLSVPDSIGRQYPTSVSRTTVNKEEKENKATDTKIEVTMQQLISEVSELKQRMNALISEKEKVKEVSWWDLHKMDVYAGLFALIFIGWLVYRWRKK